MHKEAEKNIKRINESSLSHKAITVWLYLYHRSNKDRSCFPSIPTIARETKMSESTVKRAIAELVNTGYIKKESRFRENGSQSSNLYILSAIGTPIFNG